MKNAIINNIHKNCMGTTDFDFRMDGMRKTQSFCVYPITELSEVTRKATEITIQSDTRIGTINLETGVGEMSQPHSSGAYFVHLQMDKKIEFKLRDIDLASLKLFIFTTAGNKVGNNFMHVYCDNSQAINVI
jgi:hypothetical protein